MDDASNKGPINILPTSPETNRSKRLKIDIACDTCRAKKVRCDGVRPVCGYCSRKLSLRENCRYSNSGKNSQGHIPSSAGQTSKPLSDHRIPETSLREPSFFVKPVVATTSAPREAVTSSPQSTYNSGPGQRSFRLEPRRDAPSNPSPGSMAGSISTPGSNLSGGPFGNRPTKSSVNTTSPSVIDSMTTVIDEGASTREVFGRSSAGSFTSQIKRALDNRLSGQNAAKLDTEGKHLQNGTSARLSPSGSDISYVLPPRRQADYLMDQYWFYVDPLYPFLDRDRWEFTYKAIFDGTKIDVDERLFVATLNIILALSTQLVETLTQVDREKSSNEYLQRAQELQPCHLSDSVSLELVQYLLLLSQFLQSTDQPHQTWMTVGSAIRTAQSLGMHLEETSASLRIHNERELVRKVWYGCVLMDRMVSVTHGRPSMISRQLAISVSEPSIPEPSSWTAADESDRVSFFLKSVRLYEIINRIINELYGVAGDPFHERRGNAEYSDRMMEGDEDNLDIVVKLDRCLNKWKSRTPEHLKWEKLASTAHPIHKRQTVILHMRYLHARMLLLRPVLSRFCLLQSQKDAAEMSSSLHAQLVEQGAYLCVSTAQETIAAIAHHQTSDGTIGLLPAWWYRVYYVYTAATILIAARLRPDAFPVAGLTRSWNVAMTTLKAHEDFRLSVRRCVAALHILSSKVLQYAGEDITTSEQVNRASIEHQSPHTVEPPTVGHCLDAGSTSQLEPVNSAYVVGRADDFGLTMGDMSGLDPADFAVDVNDMSWLHDMNMAWQLLNE